MHLVVEPVMILLSIESIFENAGCLMEPKLAKGLYITACSFLALHYSLEDIWDISQVECVMELWRNGQFLLFDNGVDFDSGVDHWLCGFLDDVKKLISSEEA